MDLNGGFFAFEDVDCLRHGGLDFDFVVVGLVFDEPFFAAFEFEASRFFYLGG